MLNHSIFVFSQASLKRSPAQRSSDFSQFVHSEVRHGGRERYTKERKEAHGDRGGVLVTENFEALIAGQGA